MAKKASKKAQKYVSHKIEKLEKEGYPHDQAIAIAYSYARGEGYKVGKKKKK